MRKTLVITPTYNECQNLETFVGLVHQYAPEAHILIVDDASPDGTGKIADELSRRDPRVHVMHRAGKLGLGSAYLQGFQWALDRRYDVVFEMDTDLSHDPKYMPAFLRAIDDGADLVIGSRNVPGGEVEGWGWSRHFISKGGSFYSRTILGLAVKDLTSGYKAFSRKALESLDLHAVHSEGYSFQIELTYRLIRKGLKVTEVPIVFVDRRAGQSKMSSKIFGEAVWMVWKLRWGAIRGQL
jgi:dolichol-phosphate mannosyltransferase